MGPPSAPPPPVVQPAAFYSMLLVTELVGVREAMVACETCVVRARDVSV